MPDPMPHATVEHATPRSPKIRKGLTGWEIRLRNYLTTDDMAEPLQWRTSTGVCRCVRCGEKVKDGSGARLIAGQVLACRECYDEAAKEAT